MPAFVRELLQSCVRSGMSGNTSGLPTSLAGNGVVERDHRTIKTLTEKTEISPQEAVFLV